MSTGCGEVVPVGDSSTDVNESLAGVKPLPVTSCVEDGPARSCLPRRIAHRAQKRPAEPAPLELRPDVHVVDACGLTDDEAPRTSGEVPVDARHRMPGTRPSALCKR